MHKQESGLGKLQEIQLIQDEFRRNFDWEEGERGGKSMAVAARARSRALGLWQGCYGIRDQRESPSGRSSWLILRAYCATAKSW